MTTHLPPLIQLCQRNFTQFSSDLQTCRPSGLPSTLDSQADSAPAKAPQFWPRSFRIHSLLSHGAVPKPLPYDMLPLLPLTPQNHGSGPLGRGKSLSEQIPLTITSMKWGGQPLLESMRESVKTECKSFFACPFCQKHAESTAKS